MARIKINDLPTSRELTPEEMAELFGAGRFAPEIESLEDRSLMSATPFEVNLTPPTLQAPEFQAPEHQAPQFEPPQFEAPEFQAPEFQAPVFEAPEFQAPELHAPEFQAPEFEYPTFGFGEETAGISDAYWQQLGEQTAGIESPIVDELVNQTAVPPEFANLPFPHAGIRKPTAEEISDIGKKLKDAQARDILDMPLMSLESNNAEETTTSILKQWAQQQLNTPAGAFSLYEGIVKDLYETGVYLKIEQDAFNWIVRNEKDFLGGFLTIDPPGLSDVKNVDRLKILTEAIKEIDRQRDQVASQLNPISAEYNRLSNQHQTEEVVKRMAVLLKQMEPLARRNAHLHNLKMKLILELNQRRVEETVPKSLEQLLDSETLAEALKKLNDLAKFQPGQIGLTGADNNLLNIPPGSDQPFSDMQNPPAEDGGPLLDDKGVPRRDPKTNEYLYRAPDGSEVPKGYLNLINSSADASEIWATRGLLRSANNWPELLKLFDNQRDLFKLPDGSRPATADDMARVVQDITKYHLDWVPSDRVNAHGEALYRTSSGELATKAAREQIQRDRLPYALDKDGNLRLDGGTPLFVGPGGQVATRDALDAMNKRGESLATDAHGNLLKGETGEYLHLTKDGRPATLQALEQMRRDGANYALDDKGNVRRNDRGAALYLDAQGRAVTRATLEKAQPEGARYAIDGRGDIATNSSGNLLFETKHGQRATKEDLDQARQDGLDYFFDAEGHTMRDPGSGAYYMWSPDGVGWLQADIDRINARPDAPQLWAFSKALDQIIHDTNASEAARDMALHMRAIMKHDLDQFRVALELNALSSSSVVAPEIQRHVGQLLDLLINHPEKFRLPGGAFPSTQAGVLELARNLVAEMEVAAFTSQLLRAAAESTPIGQGNDNGSVADRRQSLIQQLEARLRLEPNTKLGLGERELRVTQILDRLRIPANNLEQALQELSLRQAALDPNAPMPAGLDSNQQARFHNIRASGDPDLLRAMGFLAPGAENAPLFNDPLVAAPAGVDWFKAIADAFGLAGKAIANTSKGINETITGTLPWLSDAERAAANERAQTYWSEGLVQAVDVPAHALASFYKNQWQPMVDMGVNLLIWGEMQALAAAPGVPDDLRVKARAHAQVAFDNGPGALMNDPLVKGAGNALAASLLTVEAMLPGWTPAQAAALNYEAKTLLGEGAVTFVGMVQDPAKLGAALGHVADTWVSSTVRAILQGDGAAFGDRLGELLALGDSLRDVPKTVKDLLKEAGDLANAAKKFAGDLLNPAATPQLPANKNLADTLGTHPQVTGQAASEAAAKGWLESAPAKGGLTDTQFDAVREAARETNRIILVRTNNPVAGPLIDDLGAHGKSLHLKMKSNPVTGVITATTEADVLAARAAHVWDAPSESYYVIDADGVPRNALGRELQLPDQPGWNVQPGQILHPITGRPITSDIDLLGVIDPANPGRNLVLVSADGKELKNWTNIDVRKAADAINARLPEAFVLHGAHDGSPLTLREAGSAIVFRPDGEIEHLRNPDEIEAFYKSIEREPVTGGAYNSNSDAAARAGDNVLPFKKRDAELTISGNAVDARPVSESPTDTSQFSIKNEDLLNNLLGAMKALEQPRPMESRLAEARLAESQHNPSASETSPAQDSRFGRLIEKIQAQEGHPRLTGESMTWADAMGIPIAVVQEGDFLFGKWKSFPSMNEVAPQINVFTVNNAPDMTRLSYLQRNFGHDVRIPPRVQHAIETGNYLGGGDAGQSLTVLDLAAANNKVIHFDVTNVDIELALATPKDILEETKYVITEKELRHIFDNPTDFQGRVRFYRKYRELTWEEVRASAQAKGS